MANISQSADGVFLVTPSDTAPLSHVTIAVRAAGAGNVRFITANGDDVVCAFTAGETRWIRARLIMSTNTTSTGIEGMY